MLVESNFMHCTWSFVLFNQSFVWRNEQNFRSCCVLSVPRLILNMSISKKHLQTYFTCSLNGSVTSSDSLRGWPCLLQPNARTSYRLWMNEFILWGSDTVSQSCLTHCKLRISLLYLHSLIGVEAWHSSSGLGDTGVNDVTSVSDDNPTALHVGLHLLLLRSWTLCCLCWWLWTIVMFLVRREEEEEQEVSDVWKYNEVLSSMFTSVHKPFTTCHQAAVYRFKTCVWITSTSLCSCNPRPI